MAGPNSWEANQKFVLEKLKTHDNYAEALFDQDKELIADIAALKVKASIIGAGSGILAALATKLIEGLF